MHPALDLSFRNGCPQIDEVQSMGRQSARPKQQHYASLRKMTQGPNVVYKSYSEFKKQYIAEQDEVLKATEVDQKEAMRQFNQICLANGKSQ